MEFTLDHARYWMLHHGILADGVHAGVSRCGPCVLVKVGQTLVQYDFFTAFLPFTEGHVYSQIS